MTRLSAVVAAAVAATSTTQTESRAVSLDMAQALAMIALLSLRRSGEGGTGWIRGLVTQGRPISHAEAEEHQVKQDLPGCLQL